MTKKDYLRGAIAVQISLGVTFLLKVGLNNPMPTTCVPKIFRLGLFLIAISLTRYSAFSADSESTSIREVGRSMTAEEVDQVLFFKEFRNVKNFAIVEFKSSGHVKFDIKEYHDYLGLKVRNTFPEYPHKRIPDSVTSFGNGEWAILSVGVWTVGTNFPVAYHIDLSMKLVGGGLSKYSTDALGFASEEKLMQTRIVKDHIADLLERAAMDLASGKEVAERLQKATDEKENSLGKGKTKNDTSAPP